MISSLVSTAKAVAAKTGKNCSISEQVNADKNGNLLYTFMLVWYKGTALNAKYFQTYSELIAFAKTI